MHLPTTFDYPFTIVNYSSKEIPTRRTGIEKMDGPGQALNTPENQRDRMT
jgi:hypothetical protein